MGYRALTDEQWEEVSWLLPEQPIGRPRRRDREVFDAILYVLSTGCRWEELPKSFPPKSTVHYRFKQWSKAGVFEKVFKHLRRHFPKTEVYHLDTTLKPAKKGGLDRLGSVL